MDIERLRNDPAYWDEHAPEGATLYAPTGKDARWFRDGDRGHEAWSTRNTPGCWVPAPLSDGFLSTLIPRPTAWRGPEDGLPPVGTVCEYHGDSPAHLTFAQWRKGDRVEVIDHRRVALSLLPIVFNLRDETATACLPSVLRPLKSDKERAVEAAMDAAGHLHNPHHPRSVEGAFLRTAFDSAYDAGLLRLPEDPS